MHTVNKFFLSIAGFKIEFRFHKTENPTCRESFKQTILTHFKGFVIKPDIITADYCLNFLEQHQFEILHKRNISKHFLKFYEQNDKVNFTSYYHISMLQLEFILRNLIQKLLIKNNGFILHTSASLINGKVVLFTGPSGIGKSTAINLLKGKYPAMADDNAIIRKIEDRYYLFQLPVTEKEYWIKKGSNKNHLDRIFFLNKAKNFAVKKIDNKIKILTDIINQYWMNDKTNIKEQFRYINDFVTHFPNFYTLSFRKDKRKLIDLLEK